MAAIDNFNNDVRRAADSGVRPIEFRFFPIEDFNENAPKAYRTETVIHSTVKGEMTENYYTRVSDERDCGFELFKNSVARLIRVLQKLKESEKQVEFVSVRCSASSVGKVDFYATLKDLTKGVGGDIKSRICVEFPSALLDTGTSEAAAAVADIKALGIRTAVRGCGKEDFPTTKLTKIMPDIVYTDPSVAEWLKDAGGSRLFSSFVSFVSETGTEVIAEAPEEYKKAMSGSECVGFLSVTGESLSIEEIIDSDVGDE